MVLRNVALYVLPYGTQAQYDRRRVGVKNDLVQPPWLCLIDADALPQPAVKFYNLAAGTTAIKRQE